MTINQYLILNLKQPFTIINIISLLTDTQQSYIIYIWKKRNLSKELMYQKIKLKY